MAPASNKEFLDIQANYRVMILSRFETVVIESAFIITIDNLFRFFLLKSAFEYRISKVKMIT